jgi:transcriptional regulator with XRE-family HTH domain
MEINDMNFGYRLKLLRLNKNWTQQQMVDLFNKQYHYNFSKSAISQYENNKRVPEINILIDLADFLQVSIDYLIKGIQYDDSYDNAALVSEDRLEYLSNELQVVNLIKTTDEILKFLKSKRDLSETFTLNLPNVKADNSLVESSSNLLEEQTVNPVNLSENSNLKILTYALEIALAIAKKI